MQISPDAVWTVMLNVKETTQTGRINARPAQESSVSGWISPLLFGREFG